MAKCGQCKYQGDYEGYETHICKKTGFTPTQVEHQDALTDGKFSRVSEKALERGAEKNPKQKATKKKKK